MEKTTWDETCPHCDAKIDGNGIHESHDYGTSFNHCCMSCGKNFGVNVHAVPEFEYSTELER